MSSSLPVPPSPCTPRSFSQVSAPAFGALARPQYSPGAMVVVDSCTRPESFSSFWHAFIWPAISEDYVRLCNSCPTRIEARGPGKDKKKDNKKDKKKDTKNNEKKEDEDECEDDGEDE